MKRIGIFLIMFAACITYKTNAQQSEKLKQIFLDAEYFFLYEDYEEALYSYNTLYTRGFAENGNINYRIGQCYINIPGEKYKAIPYLEKATKYINQTYTEGSFKETNAPFDTWYYLGIAYRADNQLDKAVQSFEKFKEIIGVKETKALHLADKEIQACNYARLAMKNPQKVVYSNLGRPISTAAKDFFPAISADESMIVYNSQQKFYTAVFFSKKVNNKWTPVVNITPEIQSDGNQFVSSVSFDGTQLFLRYEDNMEANIYISSYENGRWTKSKALSKNINTKFFEGNACISKDGQTLYFSSNRSGGYGAMDLYKSRKQPNGEWGVAENLGSSVNSELNEDAPFITEDGKKLFFISQNHSSLGGYDIFYSVIDSLGNWTSPVNLGYPVNNTDDNLFYQPIKDGSEGYTSLYAANSNGKEDIYKIIINGSGTDIALESDTIKKTVIDDKELRVIPNDVVDALTKPDSSGKEKEFIILRAIFFDFNSHMLSLTAQKELDNLFIILKNYPELKIEFIGTADPLGPSQYNKQLSVKRAQAAKNYLINKGIEANQLIIKGIGETNFIAINKNADGSDCPEGRKYNRRVEIHLLDTNITQIKIIPVDIPENLKMNKEN